VPLFGLPPMTLEFVFDTTRMAANLIYSGTMERYPDIRFILSHAGGTVPFLAMRIFGTAMFTIRSCRKKLLRAPSTI